MVERESRFANNVDIGLVELAETAILGPFPAPDFLNLVPLERKEQAAGIFHDITGKRHGQIEVQSKLSFGIVIGFLKTSKQIDLLRRLALCQQLI